LIGFGILVGTLSHPVLYLLGLLSQRSPSSDFGENQLSRGLISLSLLPSSHLRIFQHSRVRSSAKCYLGFNLLKSRSPPLRVYCPRLAAHFVLAFASRSQKVTLATDNNSQTHYAKGRPSSRLRRTPTHCRQVVAGSISLPSQGFFSPFPRGTSSLSVAKEYLALSSGLDGFAQSFTCIALLGIPLGDNSLRLSGCHALWPTLPSRSTRFMSPTLRSLNPGRTSPSGLGCSAFARHYLRNHFVFFSSAY
jgi:hypothetical protein